ncbi:MAG TPA: Ku protein [Gemmataceae bacterium]
MARPSWSGFLRFNLISVPVKGFTATKSSGGKIGFHMLHSVCHSRIRYKKVCPIHGEVRDDEIVSGYETSKGHYVTVGKDERSALKAEDEKTIAVDAFVEESAVDPIYFSGRSYYLVPDGKVAQKPYSVLLEAMREEHRCAVAQVVFAGRSQVAIVRPGDGVFAMSLLSYEDELKKAVDFADEVEESSGNAEERKLAKSLIEAASVEGFDLSHYKDDYNERLAKLVEGKKHEAVASPENEEEAPAVINLMDALRQSLDRAKKAKATSKAPRSKAVHRKTG